MANEDYREYPDLHYVQQVAKDMNGKPSWKLNEIVCEKTLVGMSMSTKASFLLATVPAGYEFHFRTIQYANVVAAKKTSVKIKYGSVVGSAGSFMFGFNAASAGTAAAVKSYTNLQGMVAKGRITIVKNTASTSVVTIGGLLVPTDPGY